MTNEEILVAARKKALANGWMAIGIADDGVTRIGINIAPSLLAYKDDHQIKHKFHYSYIFTHEFARAVFGENYLENLKQMAGYENPLEYLQLFIS